MVISNWVSENYNYIKKKGLILDLACGSGRHGRFLLEKGFDVVFLDRDTSQLDWVPEPFRSQVIHHYHGRLGDQLVIVVVRRARRNDPVQGMCCQRTLVHI